MEQWIIGIATGLLSGVVVSGLFYVLAGRDLKREAIELRRTNGVVLGALRDMNAEIEYDEHGAPARLHFRLSSGAEHLKITAGGVGLVHRDANVKIISEA